MPDLSKPQIIPYAEESVDMTLFDCRWVPCSTRFVAMGTHLKGSGVLRVYTLDLEKKGLKLLSERSTEHPIKSGTFGATTLEERHLATGDFKGNLEIWDLENLTAGSVYRTKAHESIINCIDGVGGLGIGKGAPEIVTGSRDGRVKVWDVRVKDKPVACMEPRQTGSESSTRDCWSVAFGNSHSDADRMVVAGYDNGDVKMFDLRTMSVHWETNVPNGVCGLAFDRKDIAMNKLLATCLEGKFHVWDLRTKHEEKGFTGLTQRHEKTTIWGGKFLPQNRDVFMVLGGSGNLSLWSYQNPEKGTTTEEDGSTVGVVGTVAKLQDSQLGDQPVSGFDWSPDKTGLAVCTSFDQKIRLIIVTKLNTL